MIWTHQVSFSRLSPPGNPEASNGKAFLHFTHCLDTLDDISNWGPFEIVFDVGRTVSEATPISLFDDLFASPEDNETNSAVTPNKFKLRLPDFEEVMNHIFESFQCCWPDLDFIEEDLPIATALYCQSLRQGDLHQMDKLEIFTDGSFSCEEGQTGWSFVVVGIKGDKYCPIHYACGPLQLQTHDFGFTGAKSSGSRSAEIEALIMALIWRISSAMTLKCTFKFDAMTAGMPTGGIWSFNPKLKHLRVARSLAQLADTLYESTNQFEHVKAHSGQHWNELADSLAKWGRKLTAPMGMQIIDLGWAVSGETMPIEWIWFECYCNFGSNPPPSKRNCMFLTDEFTEVCVEKAFPLCEPFGHAVPLINGVKPIPKREENLELGIATYNIQSLEGASRLYTGGMSAFLRNQLQAHRIHICCLQESRAKQSGVFSSMSHFRLVAQSKEGHGGTEIWLLRCLNGQKKQFVAQTDLCVLHEHPELLIVRLKYATFPLIVIAGHAPHGSRPMHEIVQWWDFLETLINRFDDGNHYFILGLDANAHFSEEIDDVIGDLGLEPNTNENGRRFAELMKKHHLFAPSTYAWMHHGQTTTWRCFSGVRPSRCDYISIPQAWKDIPLHSEVIFTLDGGGTFKDHLPLVLWISLRKQVVKNTSTIQLDRQAMRDAPQEVWNELSQSLPSIPWEVNVHEHAMRLTSVMASWLQQKFPKAKSKPRNDFISDETWDIRSKRVEILKALRVFRQTYANLHLGISLRAWREACTFAEMYDRSWHLVYWLLRFDRKAEADLQTLKTSLRSSLRRDRTAYVEKLAADAENASAQDFFHLLRRAGVAGKKKLNGPKPLPKLYSADGVLLTTQEEQTERWRSFFAEQEDGIVATPLQLLQGSTSFGGCELLWSDVPSLQQYEMSLRSAATGKAFFLDGIPGDLLHHGAKQLALHCYQLFLKQYLTATEPALFKGGRLTSLYKGRGDPALCTSHRSIFISSSLGKAHHKLIRQQLQPFFEDFAVPLQYGGRKRKSVAMASHSLQLFLADSRQRKLSTSVLFIDVKQAFYRLIRRHALDVDSDPAFAPRVFDTLNLGKDAYQDFLKCLDEQNALLEAEVPEHLRRLMTDSFEKTWFVMSGSGRVTQTRQGSRPGDVYADMVFSFAAARLLRKVMSKLRSLGLAQEIFWDGVHHPIPEHRKCSMHFTGPIWADDIAVVLRHKNPLALLQATQASTGLLLDELALFGMEVNKDQGKTEVLLCLRGPGSQELRRQIAREDFRLVSTAKFDTRQISIIGCYKHLGVWIQADGALHREFRTRFAIAQTMITQLKTSIFANKSLNLATKMRLFDCLIASALLYNASTWGVLTTRQEHSFCSGYSKLFKRLAILHYGRDALYWSDETVRDALNVLPPLRYLCIARLRYLAQLVENGDDAIWALLQQHQPWWLLLQSDVDWLQAQRRYPLPYGPLCEDWPSWEGYILQSPTRWKGVVRRATRHALAQQQMRTDWTRWHRAIISEMRDVGELPIPTLVGAAEATHYCIPCAQRFSSKACWSVHAFRKHQRVTKARLVASGLHCGHCLRLYDSHFLLTRHLTYSQSCCDALFLRGVWAEPEPSINSRNSNKQQCRLKVPYLKCEGPSLPSPVLRSPEDLLLHEQKVLLQDLRELANTYTEALDIYFIFEHYRALTAVRFLHHDEIVEVFQFWNDSLTDGQIFTDRETIDCWVGATDTLLQLLSLDLFVDGEIFVKKHQLLDNAFAFWKKGELFPVLVDRPLKYNPVVCAHLFSGRRRSGDVQSALEESSFPHQLKSLVLSVDIIFSESMGNLLAPSTFSLFARACHDGIITIIVAGPPCETWSRARLRGEWDGGPRQVRSEEELAGLSPLTLRELEQISIGNQLLGVATRLAFAQYLAGNFFLLEHPGMPSEPGAPSIWKLDVICYLASLPGNAIHSIFSGYYGAETAKPTNLLLIHGPADAECILLQHRIRKDLPTGGSIGRGSDHTWRTSKLKEYPEALCAAISALALAHLKKRTVAECTVPIPQEFVEGFRDLTVGLDLQAPMGPDFHPLR